MKYRVVDYISNEATEETTGTCEMCFGMSVQNNDVIVIEDEKGTRMEVVLNEWSWGDLTNYYIDNIIEFSDWLSKQELDSGIDDLDVLSLIDSYYDERE